MCTIRRRTAVLGFVVLAGCGGSSTGPDPAPDFFPLIVGNSWTYAPEDPVFGPAVEWRVRTREGERFILDRPSDGSHPGPVTLRKRSGGVDLLVDGEGFVPYYRFTVGASWTRRDPWECDDGARWVAASEPDLVTTPAGTFRGCLRLERRTPAGCDDGGTMMEWWAPDVGLVKWDELNFWAGRPISYYLVERSRG